ncbi:hypothetical protein [Lysobacter sp. F6437]|uniref:hypothetical protein n=1 Tax=Lysobacter sp. F6437 TaxID=3459296 RepID=UPI00403D76F2
MPAVHRQLVLFALASALLLAGIVAYRGEPGAVVSVDAAATGLAGEAPLGARQPAAGHGFAADTPAGWPHRGVPGMPDHRAGFEHARDLYAYANTLAPAARAGDPEATWMLSRVYDYCSAYAMAPADYAGDTRAIRDMGLATSNAMVAARTRTSERCARFVPGDDLSYTVILGMTREAAEAGSLAAEAALLAAGEPLDTSDAYKHDLVDRVQQSQDPESFAALAPAMGIQASGDRAFEGQVAGTRLAEVAWQVAACDLGMECGADSAVMVSQCANGGICSRDPGQDFSSFVFDAAVPRQGADVVNGMADSLTGEKKVQK